MQFSLAFKPKQAAKFPVELASREPAWERIIILLLARRTRKWRSLYRTSRRLVSSHMLYTRKQQVNYIILLYLAWNFHKALSRLTYIYVQQLIYIDHSLGINQPSCKKPS
jgi:hypothetical protein